MSTRDIVFSAAGTGGAPIEGDFLYTWGYNSVGQAGNDGVTFIYEPTKLGTDTWLSIGPGVMTIGVKSDNTLWSWGLNSNGGLGLGLASTEFRWHPRWIGNA